MANDALSASARSALRVRHRVSIIWILPVIAALAAGWLGWRTLSERGPVIAISFASVEGLEAGKTKIKHNDVELGVIESLRPTPDLAHVIVTARMSKFAEGHLTEGTRFWIVRPRFSVEGISGLSTLVSGAYVELDPGTGPATYRFTALEEPPVIATNEPGATYTLRASRLGSIAQGAPIYYRGIKVGQVLGDSLSDADGGVSIRIFIRAPHDRLIREGTRFWNASGIAITAGDDGLKIQAESLWALLAGGIDFDVPAGAEAGDAVEANASFTLYDDAVAANDAIYTRKVRFLLHFPGAIQNVKRVAEVRMQGMRIGQVADVHIEFDAAADRVTVPVVIEIEPDRVKLRHQMDDAGTFEQRANATFGRFVARGLRARLDTSNLITGQKIVDLEFFPSSAKTKMIDGGEFPEIPTIPSDDLDSVIASTKSLLGDLQVTSTNLNGILSSPEVTRSVRSLDSSLANLDQITRDASTAGIGSLITGLRTAADSADAALKQAEVTLAVTESAFDNHRSDGGDLAGTIRELKSAARSIRVLADFLETHPDSLLLGRTDAVKR